MMQDEQILIKRVIAFPKDLKEYIDTSRKTSRRTFIGEVVYRLESLKRAEENEKRQGITN